MKLKLSELKVQSFVTSLEDEQKKTINGATGDSACNTITCGCTAFCNGTDATLCNNPATGYPCPACGYTGGDPSPTSACNTNNCGSGLATGYPCVVAGC